MAWMLMFAMCLAIDFVYVRLILYVNQRRLFQAASYSVLLTLLSQVATIFVITNYWLLVPACVGHALGTILAIHCGETHE
jgi:hypothetical protein